jgi:hypothetical protein
VLTRILSLLVPIFALVGCVTAPNELNQFYRPANPVKQRPCDPSTVQTMHFPTPITKKIVKNVNNQGFYYLGSAAFSGPLVTPEQLRRFGGALGGDLVWHETKYLGVGRGSRMVLGSYAPPSIGYSTASASSYSSSTGVANAQTPWGPVSANSYGYGSQFGTASATTYNPGQSTFVRQDFEYPSYEQEVHVWQSPQGRIRNWENIEKRIKADGGKFDLEEFLATYKEKYKTLSPQRKALADSINSGEQFTQTTAIQKIFSEAIKINQQELIQLFPD